MERSHQRFTTFYSSQHSGRKLHWVYHMSKVSTPNLSFETVIRCHVIEMYCSFLALATECEIAYEYDFSNLVLNKRQYYSNDEQQEGVRAYLLVLNFVLVLLSNGRLCYLVHNKFSGRFILVIFWDTLNQNSNYCTDIRFCFSCNSGWK